MKKALFAILGIFLIIISAVCVMLIDMDKGNRQAKNFNLQYEKYLNQEFYGAEVASLINKAIDNNEKNEVPKDDKGFYIDNGKNSIIINIKLLPNQKIYRMETINGVGINGFVENFNLINFKCTEIKYHESNNRVSELFIEQIEESF